MTAYFVFSTSLLVLGSVAQTNTTEDICLWHNQEEWSANGIYEYRDEFNGRPSYYHNSFSGCQSGGVSWYLYWETDTDDQPFWAQSEFARTMPNLYARTVCYEDELTDCTPGKWVTYEPYDSDPVVTREGMYVKTGACPEWRCDAITTSITVYGCAGPFTNNTAPNVWLTADGTRSWNWRKWGNRWRCQSANESEEEYYDECKEFAEQTPYDGVFGGAEWTSLSGGQTTTLSMEVGTEDSIYETTTEAVTVTCEGSPAPSPTMFPTAAGGGGVPSSGIGATKRCVSVGLVIAMLLISLWM